MLQQLRWRVGYKMLTRQEVADKSFPKRLQTVSRVERAQSQGPDDV
jgi:hypothetical protein